MESNIYLEQISRFIKFLKRIDKRTLDDVANGMAIIDFVIATTRRNKEYSSQTYRILIANLQQATSREECTALLKKERLTNRDMKAILAELNIPVTSKDTKSKLENKIVDNTVGILLRKKSIVEK